MPRPIPLEAPVTTHTWPFIGASMIHKQKGEICGSKDLLKEGCKLCMWKDDPDRGRSQGWDPLSREKFQSGTTVQAPGQGCWSFLGGERVKPLPRG